MKGAQLTLSDSSGSMKNPPRYFHKEEDSLINRMGRYNMRDHALLYESTSSAGLKFLLEQTPFYGKGSVKALALSAWDAVNVFYGDFSKLGLYVNVTDEIAKDILKWRLLINK